MPEFGCLKAAFQRLALFFAGGHLSVIRLAAAALLSMCAASAFSAQSWPGALPTVDVVYGRKDGGGLLYDVFHPAESNGIAVVNVDSGAWRSAFRPLDSQLLWFRPWLDAGFTIVSVRHASAPGYRIPDAIADVRRAVRHVRAHAADYAIDADRLGIHGWSSGGHLALLVATTGDDGNEDAGDPIERFSSRVAAAAVLYPPVDIRPIVGPSDRTPALDFDPKLAPAVSPILHATPDDPPILLIHGDADRTVPVAASLDMAKALSAAGVANAVTLFQGRDHSFVGPGAGPDRELAKSISIAWFERHLLGLDRPDPPQLVPR